MMYLSFCYVVFGIWHGVFGIWHSVFGMWYKGRVYPLSLSPSALVTMLWDGVFVILACCIWFLAKCIWYLARCIWYLIQRAGLPSLSQSLCACYHVTTSFCSGACSSDPAPLHFPHLISQLPSAREGTLVHQFCTTKFRHIRGIPLPGCQNFNLRVVAVKRKGDQNLGDSDLPKSKPAITWYWNWVVCKWCSSLVPHKRDTFHSTQIWWKG